MGRPQDVMFQRSKDVHRGHPLALHRVPYAEINRTSFGDVLGKLFCKVGNQVIIIIEENMIGIKDPKTFSFNFEGPKYADENLKHEIEFIIKKQ